MTVIWGTAGNDIRIGTTVADLILGLGGNDRLFGDLIGGGGPDTIFGGAGNDLLDGGADGDQLYGDDGADVLYGGTGHDRLYGRYWGATQNVPFLHFELCYYQAIDYAIANKLQVVEAGAQGEHKLARGYEPATTRSVHWIGHPGLRDAVAQFLAQERASVAREQEQLERYTPFRHGERQ